MEDTQQEILTAEVLTRDEEIVTLDRDAILNAKDLKVVKVTVPEWGGVVYVRSLSGTEREAYLDSLYVTVGKGKEVRREVRAVGATAKLAALTLCDKNGTRLFGDDRDDIKAIGRLSNAALERVVAASAKLNGLSDDAEEEAGND